MISAGHASHEPEGSEKRSETEAFLPLHVAAEMTQKSTLIALVSFPGSSVYVKVYWVEKASGNEAYFSICDDDNSKAVRKIANERIPVGDQSMPYTIKYRFHRLKNIVSVQP